MNRVLLSSFLAITCGVFSTSCSQINPEVRELLSASKPPVNPGAGEELFETPTELVQASLGGYQLTAGNATAPYEVKVEIANDVSLSAQKSGSRSYLVTWDIPSGDELKAEGVLDNPSGFNP